ncbi:uncharacterized protein LOC118237288 isoform X3 [Anguilla anguilla]|uniref:uncharacterized protein LOC118237288 isoform X3 n=1 Tax=Anguilla anguilla TaxID=7936 RepID=UPI0015B0C268|nr:uncharacterized protein LOC118237288 isoform X3 [Anguilla anguilla]
MEFLDTSDSEGTAVADSESDVDDNLYASRLMCADSFSLSPRLKVSFCATECSPVIKPLPRRKLTEAEKTALISRKINASGSVSSSEEVLACGDEGCSDSQQEKGCTAAVNCEGLNKGVRNGRKGKAESDELHPSAVGKPVSPDVVVMVTPGAQRCRSGIRAGAASDRPQSRPRVCEPSSGTPRPRRPLPSRHIPAASREEPGRRGGAGGRTTLRGSQGKGGSRREGPARAGNTEPGPSLPSRNFSEKETLSRVPSARTRVKQREGELGHKPESEPKPDTKHTAQTRSGCCASEPAVAEDSTQQDRMSCQSPPQPMGRRKTEQRPTHTRSARDRARRNGGGVSRRAEPGSRQSARRLRPLSRNMELETKRKRKASPECELSVSGNHSSNQRKRKQEINHGAQAESEKCSKTPKSKKKAALRSRGGKGPPLSAINRRNLQGETLLHRAAMDGDVRLMRAMLQLDVDVNGADYAGWTPLHEAAIGGCYEIAAALLEAGAVVNCIGDKGTTPLHDAIGYGHHQVAQLLLDSGANPTMKNEQGKTALDMTDDSSLRKMIERYLPRTRRISVSAQRRSNHNPVQEDSNRQQVTCKMQKKVEESAAKSSHSSAEAVRTRSRTPAAQGIMSQSPVAQRTVSQSPVAQRTVSQSPVAQRTISQSPVAQRTVSQSPAAQRTISQSPVAQRTIGQSPAAQRTVSQSPVAQRTIGQSPAAQRTMSQSPMTQRTVSPSPGPQRAMSQSPVAQRTMSQSPVAQRTVSQSSVAQRTMSQSPVARITRRRTGAGSGWNDSRLDLLALGGVLCEAGSREISAELRDERGTEQDRSKPAKSEDRKTASACHCSQQDVQTDADICNSRFSLSKIRNGILDYDLVKQMPESNLIPCLDKTGDRRCVENTQEQQGDLHNSRSPDLVGSMEAENKTRTKGPQAVGCEPELQDDTVSQSILPSLPVADKPKSKGTTFGLILGISGEPVINTNTSDLIQNLCDIQRDNRRENSGDSTVGSERHVLPFKAPEVLRDSDFSTNMSGESGIVRHSLGGCGVEDNLEECSISLLAPHSDVFRHMVVQQCLSTAGDRQEETRSGASVEEPTLALESDNSTPSLLFENLSKSEGFSPSGLRVDRDDGLRVVSSVNENHNHDTSSKVVNPESMTVSSDISMQQGPPDSHVKDCSLTYSMEEDQSNLHRLTSRTVTEPVPMTGASSHMKELSDSQNRGSEHQKKSVQNYIVAEHLHAVEQVSELTEINGNAHSTLSSENADRTRGRLMEEECSLLNCSQTDLSGNYVQGKEMGGMHTDAILKISPERPGLQCGEQLLKGTLLYNSASITSSCSETQVTSTIQEMENTLVTESYTQKMESRSSKESLNSNQINSLSTCNSKDMELACGIGGSFDLAMNDATVIEDVDGKTNSSYDSDCTMISESNYMERNSFGTALENVCLHPELTLGSTKGQVKDNGKRSFENAFGTSIESNTGNCKGNVTFSAQLNSASTVDSGHKTSNVGICVDVKHQNKDYVLSNFSGQQSQKSKISKTKNSCKKDEEIQQKSKHNASSKKHPGRSKVVCASACAATTSCGGPQQALKLPVRNINKRNSRGESHLHLAAKRGDLALVRALIEAGINVNQADYAGWTALHEASALGHVAVVEELLLSGADINSRGLEGLTPLHDAVASNHYETVKLLLQYGSNPNDQNVFGKSPLDLECAECIKELLSTFRGPFVSPREGSSKPPPAVEKRKPSAPSLYCESDRSWSGTRPSKESHGCSEVSTLESTITTLESVEKKQKEMSTWEFSSPEDIGKFSEAFSQIQEVLNGVLNKHKAENRELTRKYRMASDSFKQGLLREQLMSLASRQKCLLSILQKQNALKLSVQAQSCRLLGGQPSTQGPKPGAGAPWGRNTGPYRGTPEQEAPLSCHGGVSEETPPSLSVSIPGDAGVLRHSSDSTHISSDTDSMEPEAEVDGLGDAEVAMPRTDNALHPETGRPGRGLEQAKISAHQSTLPSSSQPAAGSRGDEQRSEVTGENAVDCSSQMAFLEVANNSASIAPSSFTVEHHTSQTHPTRPNVTPVPSSSTLYQTVYLSQPPGWITAQQNSLGVNKTLVRTKKSGAGTADDLQGRGFPHEVRVIAQGQRNSSETHSTKGRNSAPGYPVPDKTSSGAALSPKDQKSAFEAAACKTLPQHGDTAVRNRQLIDLIQRGVIKPGDQALQQTLKVTYRSKSPVMYAESSDLAAKDSLATQAFFPDFTPVVTHHTEEAVKTSVSNFMEINRIILISNDEFMPSHLMDRYWDVFSQSEDWAI